MIIHGCCSLKLIMMLGLDVSAIPQDEVSDSSQPVTPHMKGNISEQRVQINIPVLDVYDEETDDLSNALMCLLALLSSNI